MKNEFQQQDSSDSTTVSNKSINFTISPLILQKYSYASDINNYPDKNIAISITNILKKIITSNYKDKSIFGIENIKNKCIFNYICRLMKYLNIEKSNYVLSLVYLDRIPDNFKITDNNIYKLLLTTLLIASKLNEDINHSNYYFSKTGGIKLSEMNLLEVEMLRMIKYNLYVSTKCYDSYFKLVKKFC